jgi:hypothetical protein
MLHRCKAPQADRFGELDRGVVISMHLVVADLLCDVFARSARKNITPLERSTALPKAKTPAAQVVSFTIPTAGSRNIPAPRRN